MAVNPVRYPLTQVAKRTFAAQAAPAARSNECPAPESNFSVLPNKLSVGTVDVQGPLSRVSVAFRVGPRHESGKNAGIVHVIRSLAGFGTHKCTGFAVWKNTQHNGCHLYCTGDREVTAFHLVGARSNIHSSLKYLAAVASEPAFKRWEISENSTRLHYEIDGLSPQVKVMDSLHAAVFRTGLGNSLFVKKDRIGTYTSEMLESFYKEGFTANRASVIGYNVTHQEMTEFAKCLDLLANDLPEGNSTAFSGEIRHDVNSYFAHVAIGAKGVGMKDLKDALTYCVLQHAYGIRPVIAWGGSPSPLYKAVSAAAPDAGVSCFNAAYSDAGLFGLMISSSAKNAGKALEAAFKVLKSGTVSDADFKRAKALVKANILYNCEKTENVVEDMCFQSLQAGLVIPGPVLAEALDKISLSDVSNAARKIASEKLSLAAHGDLSELPYLDQLQ